MPVLQENGEVIPLLLVSGKFRHLPVVENGEVIALLDITKCLYDAISGMEKAAEQFDGVERQLGSNFNGLLNICPEFCMKKKRAHVCSAYYLCAQLIIYVHRIFYLNLMSLLQ